jgi:hypothetical protein
MTRDEIVTLLAEVTGRDVEEVEVLRDPHAFAKSLAAAVFSGWANEPAVEAGLPIEFSTTPVDTLELVSRDTSVHHTFDSSTTRIFGTFPLEPGSDTTVIAKWYQVEPVEELLLLEEFPVLEQDGTGFIRLDRQDGWPAGHYRLEIYESGESVEPIAAGHYRTEGEGRPARVVFN